MKYDQRKLLTASPFILYAASWICQEWRDIALAHAGLWSQHVGVIMKSEPLAAMLQRSKDVPITLSIDWRTIPKRERSTRTQWRDLSNATRNSIALAFMNAWRAKEISIRASLRIFDELFTRFDLRIAGPLLESLTLVDLHGEGPIPLLDDLFCQRMPSLKHLVITDFPAIWPVPLLCPTLKSLRLCFKNSGSLPSTCSAFLSMLEHLPLLETLELQNVFPQIPSLSLPSPTHFVSLPYLRHLILRSTPSRSLWILRHLLVHPLVCIYIECGDLPDTFSGDRHLQALRDMDLRTPPLHESGPNMSHRPHGIAIGNIRCLKIHEAGTVMVEGRTSLTHVQDGLHDKRPTDTYNERLSQPLIHLRASPQKGVVAEYLTAMIYSLPLSEVEVLHISTQSPVRRALVDRLRIHIFSQDPRAFSAIHTVMIDGEQALSLFLEIHAGTGLFPDIRNLLNILPGPRHRSHAFFTVRLQNIRLTGMELVVQQGAVDHFLNYLRDRARRGWPLQNLCVQPISTTRVDLESEVVDAFAQVVSDFVVEAGPDDV